MTDELASLSERRSDEASIAVLQLQQKTTAEGLAKVGGLLEEHVTGCAKLQKWVLGVLLFMAGWLVAHSPEGLKLLAAILGAL
jgi:hypothetical protein